MTVGKTVRFRVEAVNEAEARAVAAGEPPPGSVKEAGESYPGSILAVPLFHVTGCNCCLHRCNQR